ncbi:hypothetical protein ACWEF6_10350 [Amycolatopsis sp. NPDC004772]
MFVAQQLFALCLQEHAIGDEWGQAWNSHVPFDRRNEPILRHLLDEEFIERDGHLMFIGPEDRTQVQARLLTENVDGPRLLLLGVGVGK